MSRRIVSESKQREEKEDSVEFNLEEKRVFQNPKVLQSNGVSTSNNILFIHLLC